MSGKTFDSGFRDVGFEIKQQEDSLDEQIIMIDNWISYLDEKRQQLIDLKPKFDSADIEKRSAFIAKWRNDSHFKLEPNKFGKRYFNTYDIDELVCADKFECLLMEQANDNFKTFGINEYKSVIDSNNIPKLTIYQEKALARLGFELKMPVACFWLFDNADGTYYYAMKIIYSPRGKQNQTIQFLNEAKYAQYQCWLRNYHKNMPDFYKQVCSSKDNSDADRALKVYRKQLEECGLVRKEEVIEFIKDLDEEEL